ncbi:hypothetical protein JHD49_02645 [Sulfurimonas sp. SAG-AH-194-C21]|nr:hypothetical protein [Sulfurimonas sp. SAG-AH-194-C21]MDF1882832.1 hypothetical protein [Sulfurimonas sp. SAG-AH-194-C21]
MMYSYITPRKKSAFTQEIQLLLSFFTITLLMLFFTYTFLLYKNHVFIQEKNTKVVERVDLEKSLVKMKAQITYIETQELLSEKIYTKNTVLKDSIANLFDLIPTRITLSQAKLLKNGLILYGLTPNKDIYNFMLQAPLRSIFHRTYSSFYPAEDGWLYFVSTNYIDDMEDNNAK